MLTRLPLPTVWTSDFPDSVAVPLSRLTDGIAVDVETSGLDWRTDRLATVQVAGTDGAVHIFRVTGHRPTNFLGLLANAGVQKIFHHAMFDLRFLTRAWGVRACNVACTKIASKLLRPSDSNHSMKPLLAHYLGVDLDKRAQTSDWFAPSLAPDQLRYAAGDVIHLHALLFALSEELESRGIAGLASECYAHIPTRVALELGGFPDVYTY